MLTDREITQADFDAWKENNKWFFDILREQQNAHKDTADNLMLIHASAPYSFTDAQRQALITVTQRGAQLQDIIDIEYHEAVEVSNDPT